MNILLVNANSLSIPLADKSVHMVMTSPPYWALRDYGVPGQLGLEPSPFEYIQKMTAVFREVWRVLRDDGTLWLNVGDSYTNAGKNGGQSYGKNYTSAAGGYQTSRNMKKDFGESLKPKDLVGIPWRLAFALQEDGWYLRSDIIWHKPNSMPESVTDRPTKSHEYIFLLAKQEKYFFDNDAIKEESAEPNWESGYDRAAEGQKSLPTEKVNGIRVRNSAYSFARKVNEADRPAGPSQHREDREDIEYCGKRNKRDVWTIPTCPYPGAHFATYPPDLVEICIKAGCPEGGIVLDPFCGSATTLQVARALGRNAIGLDLSMTYLQNEARERLSLNALEAWTDGVQVTNPDGYHDLPLFDQPAAAD